jgi:5-methylcytosine-specific restriction endonuclease McrA
LDIEEVMNDAIPVQFDEIDDNFIAESFVDDEEVPGEILNEKFVEEPKVAAKKEEFPQKNVKQAVLKDTQEMVTFLDYVLEQKEENDQKFVSVRVDRKTVKIRDNYEFNVISHSDDSAIFSCLYCAKAFSKLDILMKHVQHIHLCQICFKISPSYNDLNEHSKKYHQDKLTCPFCKKNSFNQKTLRPHIKKHVTNLPVYYSVLVE